MGLLLETRGPNLFKNSFYTPCFFLFYCFQGVIYSFTNQNICMYISRLSCIFTDYDDMVSSKRVNFILKYLSNSSVTVITNTVVVCFVLLLPRFTGSAVPITNGNARRNNTAFWVVIFVLLGKIKECDWLFSFLSN